ncbi:hypothetical protein QYE76_023333 [Lolium multiflorum]|uniref:Uncharacterized protein n=1 Tax=Lolium multiflorum TaxID=4521 RepID=A0AAD8RBY5_LOLMU|nr:hypothetical protein QYE76_023333 [Lolium multiflorum]
MVRSKRVKSTTAGTDGAEPMEKKKVSRWDRSKFNPTEHRKLKKLGLLTDEEKMKAPGNEATPNPPEGYRPITKEMLDMATRVIGFRDEAGTLRESLRVAQEHGKELEKKLKASEKARKDAEAKSASANEPQDKLDAAKTRLGRFPSEKAT